MNRRSPLCERVEVLVTWSRVLLMPATLIVPWVGAPVTIAVILGLRPLVTVLIGMVVLVPLGVALFVHVRRERRTGDRTGVALRIDASGIYLGGRAELLAWSDVRTIDIWTTLNTFDGASRTNRIEVRLESPPRWRDLPAADAERVRAVVEHHAPRPVPVRVHVAEVYDMPNYC